MEGKGEERKKGEREGRWKVNLIAKSCVGLVACAMNNFKRRLVSVSIAISTMLTAVSQIESQ